MIILFILQKTSVMLIWYNVIPRKTNAQIWFFFSATMWHFQNSDGP